MVTTGIALGLTALIAYVWVLRGFFSALIHLVCTVIAGAIAFAVWEPLGYLILASIPDRGFMASFGDIAWGVSLALPFAISLGLLRAAVDSMLPANAQCETMIDYVGGGVCGALSGIISIGIFVLAAGFLRLGPGGWVGNASVVYSTQGSPGSIQRERSAFRPYVDELTVSFYQKLSENAFRTPNSLARWHPDLQDEPATLRMTYDQGKARNTLRPKDIKFLGWYTVGDEAGQAFDQSLLSDDWNATVQKVTNLKGENIPSGYITGVVVNFLPGAREKGGQVFVGNAQVRLVVESEAGDRQTLHPIALICQTDNTTRPEMARFRYDTPDLHIASVGGASDSVMAFEFAVPAGGGAKYKPIALYVKGSRIEIEGKPTTEKFQAREERDDAVKNMAFSADMSSEPLDVDGAGKYTYKTQGRGAGPDAAVSGITFSFTLGGSVIQKGNEQSLQIQESDRGGNEVVSGEQRFSRAEMSRGPLDRNLRIDKFTVPRDSTLAQVNVASEAAMTSLLTGAGAQADRNLPAQLVDANGTRYDCIGFIYKDPERVWIRYTLDRPLRSVSEAPTLSRSKSDQEMVLIFRVNKGVAIKSFVVGQKVVAEYEPAIPVP